MFGFDLKVTYDIYGADYQYDHVWRFLEDGQFSSTIIVQGPGEEVDGRHTYHIPFRIDLDVSGAGGDSFQRRGPSGWDDVEREGRFAPTAPPVWDWRVLDRDSDRSASVRARLGDNAELWALRYRRAESVGLVGSRGPGRAGLARKRAGDLRRRPERAEHERRAVVHRACRLGRDPGSVRPAFRLDGYGAPLVSEPPMHDTGHHGGMDDGDGHMPGETPPVG